jgi:hypothetical protein
MMNAFGPFAFDDFLDLLESTLYLIDCTERVNNLGSSADSLKEQSYPYGIFDSEDHLNDEDKRRP